MDSLCLRATNLLLGKHGYTAVMKTFPSLESCTHDPPPATRPRPKYKQKSQYYELATTARSGIA